MPLIELETIRTKAHELLAQLKNAVEHGTERIIDAQRNLKEVEDALVDVSQHVNAIGQVLKNCNEEIDQMFEAAEDVVAQISDRHEEFSEEVNEAFEFMEEALQDVEEFVENYLDTIKQFFSDLADDAIEQIEGTVLTPVIEMRDACIAKVAEIIDELVKDVMPTKLTEVQEEWIAELRLKLTAMIDELTTLLSDFRKSVIEGADGSDSQRSETKEMMGLLDKVLTPVVNELRRVMSLANLVGVSI